MHEENNHALPRHFINVLKWDTRSVYSQDWILHMTAHLGYFRCPLVLLLEELFESSFLDMCTTVDHKQTQHVQDDEERAIN